LDAGIGRLFQKRFFFPDFFNEMFTNVSLILFFRFRVVLRWLGR